MAKKQVSLKNAAVAYSNGRVGNIRYITKSGKTYTRTATSEVSNPRSDNQMHVRTRIGNICNCYRMLKPFLQKCFQKADKNVSIYNLFFQMASLSVAVYLDKDKARGGAAVAAPYGISNGSVPTINYQLNSNGILETDIELGGLTISDSTTVGELAEAIVENNDGLFAYGDYISFIALLQKGTAAFPTVTAKGMNVQLVKGSTEVLSEKFSLMGFATQGTHLGMAAAPEAGCFGWVHSRDNGGVLVSTQKLYNCNEEFLAQFIGDAAYEAARDSYGEAAARAFVVSDDGEGGEGPLPPVDQKVVSLSIPSAMQSMGDIQINDRTKGKSDTLAVAAGSEVTIKAIPVSGDYQFLKWSDNNTSATRTLTVSEDVTLTASFTPVE